MGARSLTIAMLAPALHKRVLKGSLTAAVQCFLFVISAKASLLVRP